VRFMWQDFMVDPVLASASTNVMPETFG